LDGTVEVGGDDILLLGLWCTGVFDLLEDTSSESTLCTRTLLLPALRLTN
jgi:hypothetical protein